MNRIYVPTTDVEDWKQRLKKPELHGKEGHSAMLLADAWQSANGFPRAVSDVLTSAEAPLPSLVPLLILPEHKVALPGGLAASQSDIWVLASHAFGLASITVEGKVSESFGETLGKWLTDPSGGKLHRLEFMTHLLGLSATLPDSTRYQLIHRLASAILEAKRFHANVALCLVESFSAADEGFTSFQEFCGLFGKQPKTGEVVQLGRHEGITFYAGWVCHHP